ncbi:T9SS type A sorting domain-containing protein [candidate division WOR-3 bacterium]|nr:T9SS type A sorting domain-containing protein [candidate division WOR-3 bacterium]
MKKLFVESVGIGFIILCIPVYAWGDNAVFNSGFDMSPWDTGWTIETDTASKYYASAEAEVKTDSGKLSPNCCYLRTDCEINPPGGGGAGEAEAKAMITQNFDGITDCKIKAYMKWNWFPGLKSGGVFDKVYARMEGYINNEWKVIWEAPIEPNVQTNWTEVCTTLVDDTLSGIRFCAFSSFYTTCHTGGFNYSYLWVDDIYVGKAGIEESEKSRVTSHKLQVYPNPFTTNTVIRVQGLGISERQKIGLEIHDLAGRVVKTFNNLPNNQITWDAKEVPAGVYFCKLKTGNKVSNLRVKKVISLR